MLFVTVVPKVYLLGAFLSIVSNVCIGMSFVLLNSFLPLLVRYHPSVQKNALHRQAPPRNAANTYASPDTTAPDAGIHEEDDNPADSMADSTAALLARPGAARQRPALKRRMSRVDSPEMHLSTQISSYGMGIGYLASVLVQSLCILIVVTMGSTLLSLRVVLLAIGAWWLVFTLPAVIWMRPRPGPPLPAALQRRGWPGYLAYAWKSLGKTVLRAWQLRDVMLFLSAWFLVSDGIATVSGTAVLFAKTELGMRPAAVAGINVIATVCGVIGAFSWRRLSRVLRLDPSQTILACICLFELIPLYGLLGYIPAVQRWGVLGLQQPWEMFLLGAVYGFVLGGLSSYCRSLFSQLIPPGSEAAFYALYAITDKGSSVFGPAIVGAITDRAGRIRPAFIFLAFLVGLPAPLMWAVDVDRGRREGGRLLRELGQTQAVDDDDEDDDGDVSDEEMLRQS
jgi:UMF1 family MFS transporter